MNAPSPHVFEDTNANFVAALRQVGGNRALYAAEDIYDAGGSKLWAKGKPIDEHLWERLADRRLRRPLETSVVAEDPVDVRDVADRIERLALTRPGLAPLAAPHLHRIIEIVQGIGLNSTEMTLLTVLREGEREMFEHACAVTAVALALALGGGRPLPVQALARAALLHDVGEIYVNPRLFASPTLLSPQEHRQLIAHPVVGALAARQLAHVSEEVAAAVEQSHERLDGSGYPGGRHGAALVAIARPLLAAEAVTGMLVAGEPHGLRHAAIALRIVPGEFPPEYVSLINGLRGPPAEPDFAGAEPAALRDALVQIVATIEAARLLIGRLDGALIARDLRAALDRVDAKLGRCQWALHATGVGDFAAGGGAIDVDPVEVRAVRSELRFRIRSAARELQLHFADDPRVDRMLAELMEVLARSDREVESAD